MSDPGPLGQLVPPQLRELLRGQNLELDRPVWGRRQGRHRSRRAGVGHDFRDHRPYAPGDDLRLLDWRAAARRDGLVMRQTEAEQELSLVMLVDGGGGMAYGEGEQAKWSVAGSIVGGLAWMALRQADRFGFALGRDGEVDHAALRPSGARARARALAHSLAAAPPSGRCPWSRLISAAAPRLPRRSMVVLVSDLWDVTDAANGDPDAALDQFLGGLTQLRAREHDIVLVQVLHRDELTFPWTERRVYRFEDLTGLRPAIEGPAASLREDYLRRSREYLERVENECESRGLHLHRIVTDEPIADAFLSLLGRLDGRVPVSGPEARP